MIGRIAKYGLKNIHKVRRVSQLARKDISTATGQGMLHSGNLAKRMGLHNLSEALHRNQGKAEVFAFKHPIKTLTGGVGAIGTYKYLRSRKKRKKNT